MDRKICHKYILGNRILYKNIIHTIQNIKDLLNYINYISIWNESLIYLNYNPIPNRIFNYDKQMFHGTKDFHGFDCPNNKSYDSKNIKTSWFLIFWIWDKVNTIIKFLNMSFRESQSFDPKNDHKGHGFL